MELSVIIPYYNADKWIGRMLDSLLDQDLEAGEYEIVVVDDGSEEEPVVLKEYAARYPQIAYHRIPHGGMSAGRNYGLSVAKGEWLHFCDSDDFVQPQVYGGILRAAQERDLEMIFFRYVKLGVNDPVPTPRRNFAAVSETMTGMEYLANPKGGFNWALWPQLVRRSVVEAIGLRFEDIYFVEDRLFKLALMRAVTHAATIDVDVYYYVQHESSFFHEKRKQRNPEFLDSFFCYADRVAALADSPDTPLQVAEPLKRKLHSLTAYYMMLNAFLYSPLDVNVSTIARLEERGLYPVLIEKSRESRRNLTLKRLMNHRRLWLLLHRAVHLLPDRVLYQRFQV
ncbi:MAG: glycosyltransferase family 2 protein [Bacteroidales bacterium]|nr:glycosyltransferase family 2 protein [Bacteroidales bacterium]